MWTEGRLVYVFLYNSCVIKLQSTSCPWRVGVLVVLCHVYGTVYLKPVTNLKISCENGFQKVKVTLDRKLPDVS